MSILSWILFGLIAGAIAKALHPGKDPGGWIVTILIGIAGAFVGGWINGLITDTPINSNWSLRGFLFAVGGAILLLWIYGMATRKRG
ncbi:GlsB/YeaQ/YmgE family stress response membrane protein [Niabella yanshanensis]|uniref:GlsB/YeaQ/YmgE family stress response membrane protein n=1 Tax=Niabella yanshanensis TaxID=577386 RepID=A0ABZ0WBG9_9BACT|nr:GlsB/YeaQ/YmgE family stress response membrane protein [Niabella yanshanensis]WQD39822.1 GlsB/YeaQ/YmgE family stress response membrane protein [Niabella yanshanensis]